MAGKTDIEWADKTWNVLRGCSRVSEGCRNCYAERCAAVRHSASGKAYEGLARMTPAGPRWTGKVNFVETLLEEPLHWRQPCRIFVNSMSDLFHEAVSEDAIQRIFRVMAEAKWHDFLVLTKRAERLELLARRLPWPESIWIGVSVENVRYLSRVAHLGTVPAAMRFISIEPLLSPIPALPLDGIGWVIVGGESGGPDSRRLVRRCPECEQGIRATCRSCRGTGWAPKTEALAWVRSLRDQCRRAGVPFFFKQWGGPRPKSGGRLLDGVEWGGFPRPHPSERPSAIVTRGKEAYR